MEDTKKYFLETFIFMWTIATDFINYLMRKNTASRLVSSIKTEDVLLFLNFSFLFVFWVTVLLIIRYHRNHYFYSQVCPSLHPFVRPFVHHKIVSFSIKSSFYPSPDSKSNFSGKAAGKFLFFEFSTFLYYSRLIYARIRNILCFGY